MSAGRSFLRKVRGRISHAPPGPFTPSDQSGIYFWCDAANYADGNWPDESGHVGRAPTQIALGARPAKQTAASPGGGDAVDFASAKYLNLPPLHSLNTLGAEIWYALKLHADPPPSATLSGLSYAGTAPSPTNYPWPADGVIYDGTGSTVRHVVGNPKLVTGLGSFSFAAWHWVSIRSAPGEFTYRINGTQVYTSATNAPSFVGAADTPTLGRGSDPDYSFNGLIAAVAVVSPPPSDRTNMDAYFRARVGL